MKYNQRSYHSGERREHWRLCLLSLCLTALLFTHACGSDHDTPISTSNSPTSTPSRPTPTATPSQTPAASDFREEFGGEQLDPARWRVSLNAYPAPGIAVSNGFLLVGQAGVTALDFPYVESLAPLFPAAGAFRLEVVMQFTSAGANGSGLSVLGANDRSLVRIWNQTVEPSGLTVTLPGARLSLNHFAPEDPHTFSMTFSAGVLNISVDGTPVVGNFPVDSQPSRIWLGHPTVGQFFGIDQTDNRPGGVNDTGMVVGRWWTTAKWSSFRLDSIAVTRLPSGVD